MIIKDFISSNIQPTVCKNVFVRTKDIKNIYSSATNSSIFAEFFTLEQQGIISIKEVARSKKKYDDRSKWLQFNQKFCRYIIDILKPNYFWQSQPDTSANHSAIETFIDIKEKKFIVKLLGIDDEIVVPLKPRKGQKDSKLILFLSRIKENPNQYVDCGGTDKNIDLFSKPNTSINAFFNRFCPELKKLILSMSPGGYKARYTPVVSPDTLDKEGITELYFFKNAGKKKHYKVKHSEKDHSFQGWVSVSGN